MKKGYTQHNKLVRDKVAERIRANGEECEMRQLSLEEYEQELRKKVHEEACEVIDTNTRESLVEEIGDLEEVLAALMHVYKITQKEIKLARINKNTTHGKFEKREFLINSSSKKNL